MHVLTQEWIDKKYAVEFRYPGELTVREDARAALRVVRTFRDFSVETGTVEKDMGVEA